MIISSSSFRRLAGRTPATIQAGRAQYLTAADAGGQPRVPGRAFLDEARRAFDAAAPTGPVALDRSHELGAAVPATTSNLLARYLVLRQGEEFEFTARATSVLGYAIKGSGRAFLEDELIEWNAGDAFLFPGGEVILMEAPDGDAVLFVVTDEPFVAASGGSVASLEAARVQPTHYVGGIIAAQLDDIATQSEEPVAQCILKFASDARQGEDCVATAIAAGVAAMAAGSDQMAHCHDADTLSLCLEGDQAYSMIEGERIDWAANSVILTPAHAEHSQHSRGEGRMFSFFVQDSGPRPVSTWVAGARQTAEPAPDDS